MPLSTGLHPSLAGAGGLRTRGDLKHMRRIIVKLGTSVVTDENGEVGLARVAQVVQEVTTLKRMGYEVILVTGGAVALGRMLLSKAQMLSASLAEHVDGSATGLEDAQGAGSTFAEVDMRACAAAGQNKLMSLFSDQVRHAHSIGTTNN